MICLEKCNGTIDQLLEDNEIDEEIGASALFQVIMTLITYDKAFKFTHNDLHTNNIMYVETDKKHLHYKVNNKHYKIKTYGKIFKIIDFGRAIYKYKNKVICSDSFHKDGDAATQYNCEPYYNDKKPLVEPNYSFDLCRLGCSIYDFITEKYDTVDDIKWPIYKIIMNWCVDDDGRNMLYKNNDEERYPDFKLYKMIARKVNKHVPMDELKPNSAANGPGVIGDIVLCPAYAEKNGKQSLERELELLTVHGVLHLLGFDHEDVDDEKKMFALQEEILKEWRLLV